MFRRLALQRPQNIVHASRGILPTVAAQCPLEELLTQELDARRCLERMDPGHRQREGLQLLVVGLDQTSAPTSGLGNGNPCLLPLAIPQDNAQVADDICFGDFLIREGVWREAGACPSGGTTESSKPSQ